MATVREADRSYELEQQSDGTAMVHFRPASVLKNPKVSEAKKLLLLAVIFGAVPAAPLVVLLGLEGDLGNKVIPVLVWVISIAAAVTLMVRRIRLSKSRGSLHTTISLGRDTLRIAGDDVELRRPDIDEVFWRTPDGTFVYSSALSYGVQKAASEDKQGKMNCVSVKYGSEEINVIPEVLNPRQAEDISGLIAKWKSDPDSVLKAA